MVDEKKAKERIKKFQTQKNAPKKWKCMRKIIDKDTPENVKAFWKSSSEEIMNCTMAFCSSLELIKDAEKSKKQQEVDALTVVQTLRECFDQLQSSVATKWRFRDITTLLTKCLAKQNRHVLRKAAFEVLLSYMEIVFEGGGGQELDVLVGMLRQSINLQVLIPEVPGATNACIKEMLLSAPASAILVPSPNEPTLAETLELFETLVSTCLNAATPARAPKTFDWWFNVIKTTYLTFFYPEVWKKLGLLSLAETAGFSICPSSIQAILIRRLEAWKENKRISDMLWHDSNAAWTMEVLRQAAGLSLSHSDVSLRAIELFKFHLLTNRNPSLNTDTVIQPFWRELVTFTSAVLTHEPETKFVEPHSKLILSALAIYEQLSFTYSSSVAPETWRHIQVTLLETSMHFLRKNGSNMLSDNKNDLVRNADDIVATLFNVWIRSPVTTQEMWGDFHTYFASVSDWPHTIRQWRLTVLKLTGILVRFIYSDKPIVISVVEPSRRPTVVTSKTSYSAMPPKRTSSSGPLQPGENPALVAATSSDEQNAVGNKTPTRQSVDLTRHDSGVAAPSNPMSASSSSLPALGPAISTVPILTSQNMSSDDTILIEVTKEEFMIRFAGVSTWTKERIKSKWLTILHIVGNINAIKSALNFELAMRCVSDVVSMLLEGESDIPLTGDYRRIPPIEIFFPWLMEACFATGEKIRGVIIAFSVVCQLFISQHKAPLSAELLSHFYRAIQVGLQNDSHMVRDHIVVEARHIFSYGLAGCTVLIPDLLTEIATIFKARAALPEAQKHAMILFNTLLCYVSHHRDIEIPDINKINQLIQLAPTNPEAARLLELGVPVIGPVELRDTMVTLMVSFLHTNMDAIAKSHIIWGSCVMLAEELSQEVPKMTSVTSILQALLSLARHPHDGVAVNASNVLSALAEYFTAFNQLDKNLPYSMINLIADAIASVFSNNGQPPPLRETLLVSLFESLTSWILAGPNDFLRDKSQAPRVFHAMELGLWGQTIEVSKLTSPSLPNKVANEEDHLTSPISYMVNQLRERPGHGSLIIRSAAENSLAAILELNNNFPTPAGATMIDSGTVELPDEPVTFFINNHEQIFSFQTLNHPDTANQPNITAIEATMVRVIVRDCSGKHCWDMSLDYKECADYPKPAVFDEPIASSVNPPAAETVPKKTDLLATLLSKYDEKHLDCLPQTPKFTKFTLPPNPDESYAKDIEAMKASIESVEEHDTNMWKDYSETRPTVNHVHPSKPIEPVSHLSLARIAMSHLGFLTPMSRRHWHLVEDCPELRAKIAELDRMAAREQHSVTVRYVAGGEEEKFPQTAHPATPSPLFEDFVSGLGWKVDMSTHAGYKGHYQNVAEEYKESAMAAAEKSVYYSNAFNEMLFEVLPHAQTSDFLQAIRDTNLVEIVWSEHRRDYTPDFPVTKTLTNRIPSKTTVTQPGATSAFVPTSYSLDASIGVYPLWNGQFRIAVTKHDTLGNIVLGPLMNGMVVSKHLLPGLVRMTASFARRKAITVRSPDQKLPRTNRLHMIRHISSDHRSAKAGELFLSALYPLSAFPQIPVCTPKVADPASPVGSSALYTPGIVKTAKPVVQPAALPPAASTAPPASSRGAPAPDAATTAAPPSPTQIPVKLPPAKHTSRAYGVSRSAGSGRDISRSSSASSGVDHSSSTSSLASRSASVTPAVAATQSNTRTSSSPPQQQTPPKRLPDEIRVTIVNRPPPPPNPPEPPVEEMEIPASTVPAAPLDDVSPFDSPFDEPPPTASESAPAAQPEPVAPAPTNPAPVVSTPVNRSSSIPPPPADDTPSPTLMDSPAARPAHANHSEPAPVPSTTAAPTTSSNPNTSPMQATTTSSLTPPGSVRTIPAPSSAVSGSPDGVPTSRSPSSSKLTASFRARIAQNSVSSVSTAPSSSTAPAAHPAPQSSPSSGQLPPGIKSVRLASATSVPNTAMQPEPSK